MAFIQTNWMLILVFVLSGGMLLWPIVQRRLSNVKDIGTLAATRMINDDHAVLLDVRETAEYEGGHLPNAIHIPQSQFGSHGAELAKMKERPVIVYCERGTRSARAAQALSKQGFATVFSLAGGISAWKAAGLPVEK